MPQTFLDGSVNIAGLTVPDVYTDIIPPSPFIQGLPSNIMGLVGTAKWGPVGSPQFFNSSAQCALIYGQPTVRTFDMPTYVAAATTVGNNISFAGVRVTDGTDTAASVTIPTSALTLTGKYTGSLGNQITATVLNGTMASTYALSVAFPGALPELFNNIGQGIGSITTVAGTTYTSVPTASVTAPPAVNNAVQAVVSPTLAIYGTATVTFGGTSGFAVNDLLYLPYGIVLKVATVATGVVSTVTIQNAGQLLSGSVPTNPISMLTTSGAGVGIPTFTVTWGLGAPIITNPGMMYAAIPTITLTGGGGTGGSYTVAGLSIWLNAANAINNGNASHPAASNYVVATAGSGTTAPSVGSVYTLSGGTDGATTIGTSTLIGSDTLPRKGMYALRSTNCDGFTLCDLTDQTSWATQTAFAWSETMWCALAEPAGGSISSAVADRATYALDTFVAWLSAGDWPSFYDAANNVTRQISPQAFQIGLAGNLAPQLSPLNKQLNGVVQTQRSATGVPYAMADLSNANLGGIDLILPPANTPGGNYFSFATGRNAWSNTAANGVEYSRLTFWLARSFNTVAGKFIGQLQSRQVNDVFRQNVTWTFYSFLQQIASPQFGVGGYGMIDQGFAVQCDLQNNTPQSIAQGFAFVYLTVPYLNTVRYFVVKLAGGGNVQVTSQSTPPTPAQFS